MIGSVFFQSILILTNQIFGGKAIKYLGKSQGETSPPEVAPLGEPKTTSQLPGAGKAINEETPTFLKIGVRLLVFLVASDQQQTNR